MSIGMLVSRQSPAFSPPSVKSPVSDRQCQTAQHISGWSRGKRTSAPALTSA